MSETGIAVPQPPPQPGGKSVVDDLVVRLRASREQLGPEWVDRAIGFLEERRAFGRRKYGQELLTHDGRDSHLDALQELVDLMQYVHKLELERVGYQLEVVGLVAKVADLEDRLAERGG